MRLFSIFRVGGLVCAAAGGAAESASGAPLTFFFAGNVNVVHDYLELDESVYVGAPFTGGYTFDPTGVTDDSPANPRVGSYYFGAAGQMWARIGSYYFDTNDLGVLIWNDILSGDLYEPVSFSINEAAGYQWSARVVQLVDESRTALSSDALPTGVPDLSAFRSKNFGLFLPGDDLGIGGRLTSLTPEPGSIVILAIGAVSLLRRSRSRGWAYSSKLTA